MHSKSAPFFELIKARRSGYALKPSSPISNAALQELVETAVTFSPTPYNTQLPRVALVLGDKHRKLWDALWEVNKKTLTPETEPAQKDKWQNAFRSGYGSVIYFDDGKALESFYERMPARRDIMPVWEANAQGILQQNIWTALAAEGLGASLQHTLQVTPGAEEALRSVLDVPAEWKFSAIMPFGEIVSPPADKPRIPASERVTVFE